MASLVMKAEDGGVPYMTPFSNQSSAATPGFWGVGGKPLVGFERRQGKWTRPECDYAGILIGHFTAGRLPGCSGGESLRTTLAECLMCTPMRITKKLSATHAIGKSCFRKKGELSAKERVELDQARTLFLASVEQKRGPAEESTHRNKRGRSSANLEIVESTEGIDTTWLGDLEGSESWLEGEETALVEEAASAAATAVRNGSLPTVGGSKKMISMTRRRATTAPPSLQSRQPAAVHDVPLHPMKVDPSVSVRFDNARGATAVRVVVADHDGLLGEISTIFKKRGLSIVSCSAETLSGDIAHDEFIVVETLSRKPITDEEELRNLEVELEEQLRIVNDQSSSSNMDDEEEEDVKPVVPNHTEANNEETPPAALEMPTTSLRVTVPDRPGLLQKIVTSLCSQRLSIVGAKIQTCHNSELTSTNGMPGGCSWTPGSGKTAQDIFEVVDAVYGGPVVDPLRLRSIEEQLTRDLDEANTNTHVSQNNNRAFSSGGSENNHDGNDSDSISSSSLSAEPRFHAENVNSHQENNYHSSSSSHSDTSSNHNNTRPNFNHQQSNSISIVSNNNHNSYAAAASPGTQSENSFAHAFDDDMSVRPSVDADFAQNNNVNNNVNTPRDFLSLWP